MQDEHQQHVSRPLIVLGLALTLIALAAFSAVGVATTALPGCESCHFKTPGFQDATTELAHGQVECVSCHVQRDRIVPRVKFGLYEAFGMWVPVLDPGSSDIAAVTDESCLSCHAEVQDRVVKVRGLSIKHSACAAESTCVDCHSEVGHGAATTWPRAASMNDCVTCHKQTKNSLACETCHDGKIESVRFSDAEFAVTHGPNWRQTHGMGQMSVCSVCHDEAKCAGCHGPGVPHAGQFLEQHAQISRRADAKCTVCHLESFCSDCHGMEMPHPKEFASRHSGLVERDGEQQCMRCHDKTDCQACHEKHVHPGGAVGPIPAPAKSVRQ